MGGCHVEVGGCWKVRAGIDGCGFRGWGDVVRFLRCGGCAWSVPGWVVEGMGPWEGTMLRGMPSGG